MAYSPAGSFGCQRKEFPGDFVSSLGDRLNRELALMKELDYKVLLLEGRPTWSRGGYLWVKGKEHHLTQQGLRNLLRSAFLQFGVVTEWTDDMPDTAKAITGAVDYLCEDKHYSLHTRPSVPAGPWMTPDTRDKALWLLQGLPGVGPAMARCLLDHFTSCRAVFAASRGDLQNVEGVGPITTQKIMEVLDG